MYLTSFRCRSTGQVTQLSAVEGEIVVRSLVDQTSLAMTVDAVNDAFFWTKRLTRSERAAAARWIATRQGLPGGYVRALPAPTEKDIAEGIRFFTGERLRTRVGVAHTLGEEACRALILLDVNRREVRLALRQASQGMSARLREALLSERWKDNPGHYCCGRCTVAVWRHITVGGLAEARPERWLSAGMKRLTALRTEDGKWRSFPFYYTLLALTEIHLPSAVREMRHAARVCERLLRRSAGDDVYDRRRHEVLQRVLARC